MTSPALGQVGQRLAICWTCLVNGSAKTEQIAAILSRDDWWPDLTRSSWAWATIHEARVEQSSR